MNKFKGKCFADVDNHVKDMDTVRKGFFFEELCYKLVKYDPEFGFKSDTDKIWPFKSAPLHIINDFKFKPCDRGIDILAHIGGKYVAIQCKYLSDRANSTSWGHVATFFGLSCGITKKINRAIFMTNSYKLCHEVIVSEEVEAKHGELFDKLTEDFFYYACVTDAEPIYKIKDILPHQQQCLDQVLNHYENETRGYIEMACGSGKTLTSYWIDKHLNNKSTIIFVPSLSLLSQFYSEWIKQSYGENIDVNYVLVGSDTEKNHAENYAFLSLDPIEIQKNISESKIKNVVICTYHSHEKVKKIKFDFGIYDESHKTVGSSDKYFAGTLFDINVNIKKRLFMTATPKMYTGKINEKIICMTNEKIYGKKIFKYNLKTAIENKKLVDYEVIALASRATTITKLIKSNKMTRTDNQKQETPAQYTASAILLLKNIHDGTCNHMVTYHNKISSSVMFRNMLADINEKLYDNQELCIYDLSSNMSITTRQRIMREFRESRRGILCTSKILNEGVNIPIIDSICFVDSRSSTIDIIQSIGRALRLYPGKERAKIFVPVLTTNDNAYDNITKILLALKTTDDRIIESFRFPKLKRVSKINFRVSEYVTENKIEMIDFKTWNENIFNRIHETIDEYPLMIKKLKTYVKINKCLPTVQDGELYKWCNDMRRKYNKNKLNEECILELESIRGWIWHDTSYIFSMWNKYVKEKIEFMRVWEIIRALHYDVNVAKESILYKNTKIHVVKNNNQLWLELRTILDLLKHNDYEDVVKNMINMDYVKIWDNVAYILVSELYVLVSRTTNAKVFRRWLDTNINNMYSNVPTYASAQVINSKSIHNGAKKTCKRSPRKKKIKDILDPEHKYYCASCDYSTDRSYDLRKHQQSGKCMTNSHNFKNIFKNNNNIVQSINTNINAHATKINTSKEKETVPIKQENELFSSSRLVRKKNIELMDENRKLKDANTNYCHEREILKLRNENVLKDLKHEQEKNGLFCTNIKSGLAIIDTLCEEISKTTDPHNKKNILTIVAAYRDSMKSFIKK